jgi:hypothetical protein
LEKACSHISPLIFRSTTSVPILKATTLQLLSICFKDQPTEIEMKAKMVGSGLNNAIALVQMFNDIQ